METSFLMYAVRNRDGKWLRSKGYNGYGECWVDDIKKAKIYPKIGTAKTQITYWAKNYPQYGAPDLVEFHCQEALVIDQTERTTKAINKIKLAELRHKQYNLEHQIKELAKQKGNYQAQMDKLTKEMKKVEGELKNNS
jgi:hypothetical protein